MKITRMLLALTILLIIILSGCTEKTSTRDVSYSNLITASSEYNGKNICVKGEINDLRLNKKIKLENYDKTQYRESGIYARVCGIFNEQDGIYTIDAEHIEPLLITTTDKNTYHSKEELQVQVTIFTEEKIPRASVEVTGITNSFNRNLIEETKKLDLDKGENTITFTFTTPDCEECAGLEPGLYYVTSSILIKDELQTATVPIILQGEN